MTETDQQRSDAKQFLCVICEKIVKNPLECPNCVGLFCLECIWAKGLSDRCPKKCSPSTISFNQMNSGAGDKMAALRFRCMNDGCDLVYPYQEAFKHVKDCLKVKQPCPLGCGKGLESAHIAFH